ncbi:hypothetical protein EVAR_94285_1 [Eumeta japonica]|uniref:Uncharacterized protein n=1 Tax=Eumeta variegata TaxID=151549 RepID=A0A4C1UEW3_EUMVA|nr:hypothetical protein EVAR_94285_1 [Eumeta japonica]
MEQWWLGGYSLASDQKVSIQTAAELTNEFQLNFKRYSRACKYPEQSAFANGDDIFQSTLGQRGRLKHLPRPKRKCDSSGIKITKGTKSENTELRRGEIEIENRTKIGIDCETKIGIKSVIGIGIRSSSEIRNIKETEKEGRAGSIQFYIEISLAGVKRTTNRATRRSRLDRLDTWNDASVKTK